MHAKTDASLIPIKTDRMKEKVISPLLKWAQTHSWWKLSATVCKRYLLKFPLDGKYLNQSRCNMYGVKGRILIRTLKRLPMKITIEVLPSLPIGSSGRYQNCLLA